MTTPNTSIPLFFPREETRQRFGFQLRNRANSTRSNYTVSWEQMLNSSLPTLERMIAFTKFELSRLAENSTLAEDSVLDPTLQNRTEQILTTSLKTYEWLVTRTKLELSRLHENDTLGNVTLGDHMLGNATPQSAALVDPILKDNIWETNTLLVVCGIGFAVGVGLGVLLGYCCDKFYKRHHQTVSNQNDTRNCEASNPMLPNTSSIVKRGNAPSFINNSKILSSRGAVNSDNEDNAIEMRGKYSKVSYKG